MVHSGHDIRLISDFVSSFLSALIKFRWPNIIILLLKMNCMRFLVCVTGSKLYCSNSGLPWVWNLNFHVISKFNATKIRFSKKATKNDRISRFLSHLISNVKAATALTAHQFNFLKEGHKFLGKTTQWRDEK